MEYCVILSKSNTNSMFYFVLTKLTARLDSTVSCGICNFPISNSLVFRIDIDKQQTWLFSIDRSECPTEGN